MKAKKNIGIKIVCNNRKAKFNYFFQELMEAGIVLKDLRLNLSGTERLILPTLMQAIITEKCI